MPALRQLFDGKVQDFGETSVAVENVTRSVQCCRALVDRFDEHAVRKFGALQGDNPVATGALHHQGVNAAASDSLDDLLGFVVASSLGAHNGDTTSAPFGAIFCQRCFLVQRQIFPRFSLSWPNGTRKRNIGIFVYK